MVDPETLTRRDVPLADARQGAFDGAGRFYFTRFGLDVTGDNVREYRGGAMAELWRFDLDGSGADAGEAVRLAREHEGNLTRPMWWNGALYVVSDADGVFNLWRLDAEGRGAAQLTSHADFEVRGATLADGRIVYQHGADIRLYDIASGRDEAIDIRLSSDRSRPGSAGSRRPSTTWVRRAWPRRGIAWLSPRAADSWWRAPGRCGGSRSDYPRPAGRAER
jgi:tricorn protease